MGKGELRTISYASRNHSARTARRLPFEEDVSEFPRWRIYYLDRLAVPRGMYGYHYLGRRNLRCLALLRRELAFIGSSCSFQPIVTL